MKKSDFNPLVCHNVIAAGKNIDRFIACAQRLESKGIHFSLPCQFIARYSYEDIGAAFWAMLKEAASINRNNFMINYLKGRDILWDGKKIHSHEIALFKEVEVEVKAATTIVPKHTLLSAPDRPWALTQEALDRIAKFNEGVRNV